MNITPHTHLLDQAREKGIAMEAVVAVLRNPDLTYPSFVKDARGQRVPRACRTCGQQGQTWTGSHNGQKIAMSVYPCCRKAITVWFDQIETAIRPDQKAKGVKGYIGRDGRWRA